MKESIIKLSKYGNVKTCKVINDQIVTIVITNGFWDNLKNTSNFIIECTDLFPEYTILETCITDNNLAILVLKK